MKLLCTFAVIVYWNIFGGENYNLFITKIVSHLIFRSFSYSTDKNCHNNKLFLCLESSTETILTKDNAANVVGFL
jgi:hypothetical protein